MLGSFPGSAVLGISVTSSINRRSRLRQSRLSRKSGSLVGQASCYRPRCICAWRLRRQSGGARTSRRATARRMPLREPSKSATRESAAEGVPRAAEGGLTDRADNFCCRREGEDSIATAWTAMASNTFSTTSTVAGLNPPGSASFADEGVAEAGRELEPGSTFGRGDSCRLLAGWTAALRGGGISAVLALRAGSRSGPRSCGKGRGTRRSRSSSFARNRARRTIDTTTIPRMIQLCHSMACPRSGTAARVNCSSAAAAR